MSFLVVLGFGAGCSDPPNDALKSKLTSHVQGADKLVIDASSEYTDLEFQSVEISGVEKVQQFLDRLEFSTRPRFRRSRLRDHRIDLLTNEKPKASLTFRNGRSINWKESDDSSEHIGILRETSLQALLLWFATNGCDIVQREKDATDKAAAKRRQAEQNAVACFPPETRHLFNGPGYGVFIPTWAEERGEKLASAINNPIKLLEMVCRGYGCLDGDWGVIDKHEQILGAAARRTSGQDFARVLAQIRDDRRALLGAGRIFFRDGYTTHGLSIDPNLTERDFWAARIGEVVANDGDEQNFPKMCLVLQDIEGPLVQTLLRNLARGQTGKAYTARGLLTTEPTLSASAYLCLALRADTGIMPELEAALTTNNTPTNRAALEMAVAALDRTVSVRNEHLTLNSWFLGLTGLKVVAKAPTRENMDALVYGGFHHPIAIVNEKAFSLFEEVTGHKWSLQSRYKGDAQRWWEQHRTEFPSRVEPSGKK